VPSQTLTNRGGLRCTVSSLGDPRWRSQESRNGSFGPENVRNTQTAPHYGLTYGPQRTAPLQNHLEFIGSDRETEPTPLRIPAEQPTLAQKLQIIRLADRADSERRGLHPRRLTRRSSRPIAPRVRLYRIRSAAWRSIASLTTLHSTRKLNVSCEAELNSSGFPAPTSLRIREIGSGEPLPALLKTIQQEIRFHSHVDSTRALSLPRLRFSSALRSSASTPDPGHDAGAEYDSYIQADRTTDGTVALTDASIRDGHLSDVSIGR
jgi:hypothetical protein